MKKFKGKWKSIKILRTSIMEEKKLKCYTHVVRMDDTRIPKNIGIGYYKKKERRRGDPNKGGSKDSGSYESL